MKVIAIHKLSVTPGDSSTLPRAFSASPLLPHQNSQEKHQLPIKENGKQWQKRECWRVIVSFFSGGLRKLKGRRRLQEIVQNCKVKGVIAIHIMSQRHLNIPIAPNNHHIAIHIFFVSL